MSGHQTTRRRYTHVPAIAAQRRRIDAFCREFARRNGRFGGARIPSAQRPQECLLGRLRSTLDRHDRQMLLTGGVRDLKLKLHVPLPTDRDVCTHVGRPSRPVGSRLVARVAALWMTAVIHFIWRASVQVGVRAKSVIPFDDPRKLLTESTAPRSDSDSSRAFRLQRSKEAFNNSNGTVLAHCPDPQRPALPVACRLRPAYRVP